jgi:hypothetical protein
VLLVQWLGSGDPLGFFHVQAHYGAGVHSPLDSLLARLKPLINPRYRSFQTVVQALQTLLSATLVVWLLAKARTLSRELQSALFLCAVAVLWLFPLVVGGQLSLHRSEAMLLPAVLLAGHLPVRALWAFAAAATAIAVPMTYLFFRGSLV